MPELPEVEAARELCETHCVGKRVLKIHLFEGGGGPRNGKFDDKMGRILRAATRVGKRAILQFAVPTALLSATTSSATAPTHVVFGFGMTGALTVRGVKAQKFKEFTVWDETWPPRWCKLELEFKDGTRLAYSDSRRFGRLQLLGPGVEPLSVPPVKQLAPDPLDASRRPSEADFATRLRTRRAPVKAALLDQNFVLCGLGNWLVDDILHAARVHPGAQCCRLSDVQCVAILRSAVAICTEAVRVGADGDRFPETWLFHQRWGVKQRGRTMGGLRTANGDPIQVGTVAGRTTLWVPTKQKKYTPATPVVRTKQRATHVTTKCEKGKAQTKKKIKTHKQQINSGLRKKGETSAPQKSITSAKNNIVAIVNKKISNKATKRKPEPIKRRRSRRRSGNDGGECRSK